MPRPHKRRRICAMPKCNRFGPIEDSCTKRQIVTMTVDEFETIRLIDLEGMTQESCAEQMNIARTTAQSIYTSARVKLAECLVNQKELKISGGNYVLCADDSDGCGCAHHCKRRCHFANQQTERNQEEQ